MAKSIRASVMLVGILVFSEAFAQQNSDDRFKEVQVAATQFSLADSIPSWVSPTTIPDAANNQPVVVRLADTQLLVDRVPVLYYRRAVLINDAASLTAAGRFSISFAPEYQRVQLHSVYIYRGLDRLDRTTTSTIRFLQREQGLEQGVYSGVVTASILVDDLRAGDTLEYSYSLQGQNPVFGGKYSNLVSWDQGYPTLFRRVVLNHPVDRKISWRMIGDLPAQPLVPTDTIREGMRKIEFEQRSLPESVNEAQIDRDFFPYRFLQFSEFSNWSEVANWASTLFQTDAPVTDEIKEVAKRIRALDSDEAKVTAALEFVQSEIRYFSIALGESSHRPEAPEIVLRRRYGDCKDKSLLLITLLRELGIASKPVLLEAGRRSGLEKTLPSAQFFDHAIVQVSLGEKVYFLDPTRLGQHGRLDRMGQAHEGSQVLVVAPETSGLSTISTGATAELVQENLEERVALPKLGENAEIQVRHIWRGLAAENIRVSLERVSHDQYLRWIGAALERRYPGTTLVGEPTIDDDRTQNTFVLTSTYKAPKLVTERDGNWIASFRPDNVVNVLVSSPTPDRKTPLRIPGHPYRGRYSFEITFPDEVSVITDPIAKTITNKYFSLTSSLYFRGNIAKASVDLDTLKSQVDAEDYSKYVEDLRASDRAIGGYIYVGKGAIKSTDTSAGLDLADRLRGFRLDAIKKLTEVITSGKLSGADLADSYCARSEALSDLERHEEALQDATAAMAIAPNSPASLMCRGYADYNSGSFEKSIADYSKAISLGGIKAEAFRQRGIGKFITGQFSDAITDFTRASELADKETGLYCDLWLTVASLRLGKSVPDSLAKRISAEKLGEWPRPALAMLIGSIPPEQLLKIMNEKKGDERLMAQAEGYFYLGQHYLSAGDQKTAQGYFEKVRALGVIIYTEHIAAGFELKRMNGNDTSPPSAKRAVAQ